MRIYVCVPHRIFADESAVGHLHFELHRTLTKFYGRFPLCDIEFFRSKEGITVYVMEELPRLKNKHKAEDAIIGVFHAPVDIKLDYQKIAPDFKPVSFPPPYEDEIEKLSRNYHAEEPLYTFEQVILPETTRIRIEETLDMMSSSVKQKVFVDWGLQNIVPHPVSAINFYGPPGTGKTMAAEAVAAKLHKKIIRASYADIESKYHGEGPKRLKAIFLAAKRDNAVLFIDEADSLLSKRLQDVSNGSEQAINSMRSQLLIAIEHFDGVVIFATNLIENYDKAFISRVICIAIPAPDTQARKAIWDKHICGRGIVIPLSDDVDTSELSEKYSENFYGREIRNAVIRACTRVAVNGNETVTQADFLRAAEDVEKDKNTDDKSSTQSVLKKAMQKKLDERKQKSHAGTTFWKYKYHPRFGVTHRV